MKSIYSEMLAVIGAAKGYNEKAGLTQAMNNIVRVRKKPNKAERILISEHICGELNRVITDINKMAVYSEKCEAFNYGDRMLDVLVAMYPQRNSITGELDMAVREYFALVKKERFFEEEITHIFELNIISRFDIEKVIETYNSIEDLYQRGMLFAGLINFQHKLKQLPSDAKAILTDFVVSEFEKCLSLINDHPEYKDTLETICDLSRHLSDERISSLLKKVLESDCTSTVFYSFYSLVQLGEKIPDSAVDRLSGDFIYADLTYCVLRDAGMEELFPENRRAPEYLAKSNLIHWLSYPTELGGPPDEIELVGAVTKKSLNYYFFKFRSSADTLSEDVKNVWLLGWADMSREGGTFSRFEPFSEYEKSTPEATLKYLRKKIM